MTKADKRFDSSMFSGRHPGPGNMPDYWLWLRVEHFLKHVLRDRRREADIVQLAAE